MLQAIKSHIVHAVALVRSAIKDATAKRSSAWPAVEKRYLGAYPNCAACDGKVNLNVHHIKPFHLQPALELDTRNLITLCMARDHHCHILIGHGDDFKAYNPHVKIDAAIVLAHPDTFNTIAQRIKLQRKYE